MHRFKIVVPSETGDDTEVDATLQGRDERTSPGVRWGGFPQKWKAIQFVDARRGLANPLYSVGIFPRERGIKRR